MRLFLGSLLIALWPASAAARTVPVYLIHFESNSARIASGEDAVIANAARFRIEGHADRAGPATHNQRLSRRRAEAVAAALIRHGVPANALEIGAWGEDRLMVDTQDGVGDPRNRRAEIMITCFEGDPEPGFRC
jgi:OOP family OmpA-OmpF porin